MPSSSLTRRGLLGRRILRRFLYSQLQLRQGLMIALGRDAPLVRFTVEADPPSIYLVFEIRDVEALAAHLRLPAPLVLAPIRCLDGEEPGNYLTLNVYRVSGITNGLRAEWSVYATDAGGVPRYVVVDARSSARSMDPVDIVTPASRVDHVRSGDRVTTVVGPDGEEIRSAVTIPASAPAAVTAREWSTANDFIYWRNGICDRTFYDAGMADAHVVSVDPSTVEIEDRSPWARFVDPRPVHVLVFREAIELVVSPWANVDTLAR